MAFTADFNKTTNEVTVISQDIIEGLKTKAILSPQKIFRFCLHNNVSSALQQMIVVMHKDTLFSPHRHPANKIESIHLIEGEMDVVFFSDGGEIQKIVKLSHNSVGSAFLYRIEDRQWHLPISLTEWVVFHEIYTGPYDKSLDVEFAPFAPSPFNKKLLRSYYDSLLNSKIYNEKKYE